MNYEVNEARLEELGEVIKNLAGEILTKEYGYSTTLQTYKKGMGLI